MVESVVFVGGLKYAASPGSDPIAPMVSEVTFSPRNETKLFGIPLFLTIQGPKGPVGVPYTNSYQSILGFPYTQLFHNSTGKLPITVLGNRQEVRASGTADSKLVSERSLMVGGYGPPMLR